MAIPTDPLMSLQWWQDGLNLDGAWSAGFTGEGVWTVVIDNGFDYTHTDIAPNYFINSDFDFETNAADAFGTSDAHGTAVAGILAADNNGSGVVGVAFDSKLIGYRTVNAIGNPWLEDVRDALHHAQATATADVVNMSQGMSNIVGTVLGGILDQSIVAQIRGEIGDAVNLGRDGLGILLAKSAGNARETNYDVNADMWTNDTRQVVVAAVNENGTVTNYSSYGAAILVSAFGGPSSGDIYTTDRVGAPGYSSGDFANFSGTSAATPMVGGIMSLMLDANDDLGWRDVQDILAYSARHVGSAVGGTVSGFERDQWTWNGASNWNGGGLHYSNDYGYGLVDATAATRLAESWHLGGFAAETTANQASTYEDDVNGTFNITAEADNEITFNITETQSIEVERVRLTVTFSTTWIADVEIYLISPDGTRSVLLNDVVQGTGVESNNFTGEWIFESQEFRGELSNGTWQVQVIDDIESDNFTVTDIVLETFGSAVPVNDRYLFTNEYSDYFGLGGHATTIVDPDGGVDTVNAAAVTAAVNIGLVNGVFSSIDGVSVRVYNMENVVSGDGNDTLTGNTGANLLYGMRGYDYIQAGEGNDQLFGGNEADALFGGGGNDILEGGQGSDSQSGGNGNDYVSYLGSNAAVKVNLATGVASGGHATGDKTYVSIEHVIGSNFGDTLIGSSTGNGIHGNGGRDVMTGGGGPDRFYFNAVRDTGTTVSTRDWIMDFFQGLDAIDLRSMDASTLQPGNNNFTWRGAGAFTTSAVGEVRYELFDNAGTSNDYTIIWGDVDNDLAAEFSIHVVGLVNFNTADILL